GGGSRPACHSRSGRLVRPPGQRRGTPGGGTGAPGIRGLARCGGVLARVGAAAERGDCGRWRALATACGDAEWPGETVAAAGTNGGGGGRVAESAGGAARICGGLAGTGGDVHRPEALGGAGADPGAAGRAAGARPGGSGLAVADAPGPGRV